MKTTVTIYFIHPREMGRTGKIKKNHLPNHNVNVMVMLLVFFFFVVVCLYCNRMHLHIVFVLLYVLCVCRSVGVLSCVFVIRSFTYVLRVVTSL